MYTYCCICVSMYIFINHDWKPMKRKMLETNETKNAGHSRHEGGTLDLCKCICICAYICMHMFIHTYRP